MICLQYSRSGFGFAICVLQLKVHKLLKNKQGKDKAISNSTPYLHHKALRRNAAIADI
jgi:hypothetical protein